MTEPTKILYVGGLGRSGSTLLERALSQFPGVCGLGETVYMWQRGVANNEQCGCGTRFRDCEFWTQVGKAAFGGWDQVDIRRVAQLQESVDDVKHIHRLTAPRLAGRGFQHDLAEYLELYERLYAGVREVSGQQVIVDSSKITSLAYVLNQSDQLDLRLVHILRDPRAVAHAWTKVVRRPEVLDADAYMPRYTPAYMGMLYAGHHVLLEALRMRGVPQVRVRYEDFAERPIDELRRVADKVGIPFQESAVVGQEAGALSLGVVHTASGNPSRFDTGDVLVRRDEKWRSMMPRNQQAVVSAITAPVAPCYGYPLRAPRDMPDRRQS